MVDKRADGRGDAVPFISHNNQASPGKMLAIDIFSIQQRAIYGIVVWQRMMKRSSVLLVYWICIST